MMNEPAELRKQKGYSFVPEEDFYKTEEAIRSYMPQEIGLAKTVYRAMNEAILNGGKRIRPLFVLETAKFFDAEIELERIAPFMAAVEMIHTSSLIHDDLPCMDNDILRRGKPTTWVSFGEDMAVLAGDALIVEAGRICLKAITLQVQSASIKSAAKAGEILFEKTGMQGMIGGQVVDVEKTGKMPTQQELDFIYHLKTGALLEASLMMGAILGGANEEEIKRIERVAACIGMAFQIQDDILDEISTEEELGKPIHSDEKNQKYTYVTFFGLDRAKEEVNSLSLEAIALVQELSKAKAGRNPEILIEMIHRLIHRKN